MHTLTVRYIFIIELDNLWFISNLFATHVNVSCILNKKVREISLSENECIINNKKNPILLNWGAKKILDASNMEVLKISEKMNKSIGNYFNAYFIT